MELIAHIGDGKAGSSAIQEALGSKSADLLARGILYDVPKVGSGHFNYVTLVGNSPRTLPPGGAERIKAHVETLRAKINKSKPKFVIMSAESFMGLSEGQIEQLLEAVNIPISGIHCVGFVRDPADYFVSATQQALKLAPSWVPPSQFSRSIASKFEVWASIPKCASVWGSEFDRETLAGGSAVSEFASIVSKISGEQIVLPDSNSNESLMAEQVVALQAHHSQAPDSRKLSPKESAYFVRLFTYINRTKLVHGSRVELKAGIRSVIYENNSQDVNRLMQMFPWFNFRKIRELQYNPSEIDASSSKSIHLSDMISEYDKNIVELYKAVLRREAADSIAEKYGRFVQDPEELAIVLREFQ